MAGLPISYAVDVSSHQDSHQPWTAFGVNMGIAKASEGQHSHDEWFVRHIADIKKANLIPAAYHFAWPNQDVAAEAANYVAAVRPVNSPNLVHFLDLEPYPNGAKNYTGQSDEQIKAWATAWVAAVRRAFPGQRVLTYTPRDAYTQHFPAGTDGYWYPAYPVQGRSFAAAAALTRPVVNGRPVWGWQFTSVPRDQTVIYMAPAQLHSWAAGTTPITPQQEDDVSALDVLTYRNAKADAASVAAGHGHIPDVYGYLVQTNAEVRAMHATIATLVPLIGKNVDTDTVVAAVQQAIADATVHVQVDVTGDQPTP